MTRWSIARKRQLAYVKANYKNEHQDQHRFRDVNPKCSLHESENFVWHPITQHTCLIIQERFGAAVLTSNLSKQPQSDNDDQDGADDTNAAMPVAVTVAAKAASQTAEQENNEDGNEDESYRHGLLSGGMTVRSLMAVARRGRSIRPFPALDGLSRRKP